MSVHPVLADAIEQLDSLAESFEIDIAEMEPTGEDEATLRTAKTVVAEAITKLKALGQA